MCSFAVWTPRLSSAVVSLKGVARHRDLHEVGADLTSASRLAGAGALRKSMLRGGVDIDPGKMRTGASKGRPACHTNRFREWWLE